MANTDWRFYTTLRKVGKGSVVLLECDGHPIQRIEISLAASVEFDKMGSAGGYCNQLHLIVETLAGDKRPAFVAAYGNSLNS